MEHDLPHEAVDDAAADAPDGEADVHLTEPARHLPCCHRTLRGIIDGQHTSILAGQGRAQEDDLGAVGGRKQAEQQVQRKPRHRQAADCRDALYNRVYLNFCTPLPRPLLEALARATLQTGSVGQIAKLYDQFLGFVSLEPNLFTLNIPRSFVLYNDPRMPDTQIEATMLSIAQGLFSVFVALGVSPIIKCAPDGPARMVAGLLDGMVRDHSVLGRGALGAGMADRPLLVLVDRAFDLAVGLQHTSTYQALVDDLVGSHLRKVTLPATPSEDGRPSAPKSYDLDLRSDPFWLKYGKEPFPNAIEGHELELKSVTENEARIRRTATHTEDAEAEMEMAESLGTKGLVDAVDSLPALLKQKKMLEMHTNVLQAIMNQIKLRHVPRFFEEELTLAQDSVLALLADPAEGSFADKVRLAACYLLSSPTGIADYEGVLAALNGSVSTVPPAAAGAAAGAGGGVTARDDLPPRPSTSEVTNGLAVLEYVKKSRKLAAMVAGGPLMGGGGGAGAGGAKAGGGSQWLASLTHHTSTFITKAAQSVKALVSGDGALPVTRLTQCLMEGRSHPAADTFVTLDPRLRATEAVSVGAGAGVAPSFSSAVVFMIGGGNYKEYHNLQDYAKGCKPPVNITYGCTELVRPEAFMAQLAELGLTM